MNTIEGIATDYGYYRLTPTEAELSRVIPRRRDGNYDMRNSYAKTLIKRATVVTKLEYEAEAS